MIYLIIFILYIKNELILNISFGFIAFHNVSGKQKIDNMRMTINIRIECCARLYRIGFCACYHNMF